MARTKKDGVQSPIETPLKPHHILYNDAPCPVRGCHDGGRRIKPALSLPALSVPAPAMPDLPLPAYFGNCCDRRRLTYQPSAPSTRAAPAACLPMRRWRTKLTTPSA